MNETQKATLMRIGSAVVALPVYIFAFLTDYFHGIPILIVSSIVSLASLYEYYHVTEGDDRGKPFLISGLIFTVILNIVVYLFAFGGKYNFFNHGRLLSSLDIRGVFILFVLFITIVAPLQLFKREIRGGSFSLGVTFFGIIYIVIPFSHIILLKALPHGVYYILILNIVVMINDSGAYFGGVLFGKHKTGFAVSPNKSWEGYFSGFILSVIAMLLSNYIFISFFQVHLFGVMESLLLGAFLSLGGNIGDLIESAIKRDGSMKDSGSIIPGHGGMWDVFDALIFTTPLFYYYILLRGLF